MHAENVLHIVTSKTVSESITYYQDSTSILQQGGFRLRSWATNNSQLNDVITQDDHDCHESTCTVKILGMIWNTQLDLLSYPSYSHSSDLYTKREIVRLTSSLFDPLGYLSPVHISAKIFIQKLWQLNLEWDKPLNEEIVDEWKIIHGELDSIRKITIQRPYFSNDINSELSHELHVFADASPKSYGVVVYLKHGSTTAFVMSKSRVKPLKDITLPRMELLATFIATRLSQFILKAFSRVNIQKVVLWSDSQIVLHWIKGDKKLPMFVENRVKVIRDASFSDIKYCPTTDNPADLLTRGISSLELQQSTLWTCGPSWLPNGDWPICDLFDSAVLACYIEPCEHDIIDPSIIVNTLHSDTVSVVSGIDNVIDITRFPSLGKLLRVTSYVLRFINRLKHCITLSECKPYITVTELQIAQNKWIKAIQSTTYPRELKSLQNKSGEKLSLVQQLKLFIGNDGLLRCGGRFQHANVVFSAKYPILIPRRHYFTELVVRNIHALTLHTGVESTITNIRQYFWIPQIRQVVKYIIQRCVTCLKVIGKPYRKPETPPLPKCRLLESPPFTVCGVDFTGALYYKSDSGSNSKAYICLFTCAVTRAIHLEVVTDMTTQTFLQAFRRFVGRCSLPSQMISDNGSTFLAAAEDIQRLLKDPSINNYMANRSVQWTFIPKRAPWFGGFYERLIGMTKNVLKKTLGRSLVTLNELNTLVVEVEAVINDRPITYVPSDVVNQNHCHHLCWLEDIT